MKRITLALFTFVLGPAAVHAGDPDQDSPVCDLPDRDIGVVESVSPIYPAFAAMFCIEGHVEVRVTVAADGDVQEVSVIESDPAGVFDRAGDIFTAWKFRPACAGGIPVERSFTTTLDFEMDAVESAAECSEPLPQEVNDLLISLTVLLSETTEQLLSGAGSMQEFAPTSSLDEPFASIETAYRRYFNQTLAAKRSYDALSWDWINLISSPDHIQASPDPESARREVRTLFDKRRAVTQAWMSAADRLGEELSRIEESFEFSPAGRWMLFGEEGELEREFEAQQAELIASEEALFERYVDLVDWLIDHRSEWEMEAGGMTFGSAEPMHAYNARVRAISELELQAWTRFLLPAHISSSWP